MRIVDEKALKEINEHFGKKHQSVVCMEECAELIQCISKELRGKSDVDHMTEEIADVCICIETLKQLYGITDEQIQVWIDFKQKRAKERIRKEQK